MSRANTRLRRRPLLLVLLAVVVYGVWLLAYFIDGRSGPSVGPQDPPAGGVLVSLTPVSVDATAAVMTVYIDVTLDEALADPGASVALNQAPLNDISVELLETVTGAPLRFPARTPITRTRVQMYATGFIRDWPFDRYSTTVIVTAESHRTGEAKIRSLPIALSFDGALQGWDLFAAPDPDTEGRLGAFMDVGFRRALGVVIFGGVVVAVLVTLPVLGLIVVLNVARRRRKFEPAFLGWITAMLFATIPIRNFLPGSPPPGSWLDVAIVLWVVVALAVGLVIGVLAWMRQSPVLQPEPEPADVAGTRARELGDPPPGRAGQHQDDELTSGREPGQGG